jgi:hypothetical protein
VVEAREHLAGTDRDALAEGGERLIQFFAGAGAETFEVRFSGPQGIHGRP